ncbi:MAG: stalk domain-containing protein [Defluviitaleaceae bacterium]|nr:stalk domain-containing protein [Defluviitaleaceae bacterium]MCL2262604.1 stalk domain-containing protein [Defluviitaleaceae bacterium]
MKIKLLIVGILISVFFALPVAAHANVISVEFEWQPVDFPDGVVPVNIDGRVLVPARGVFETMGGVVEWDGDAQRVTIIFPHYHIEIVLGVGNSEFTVNGAVRQLEVPAQILHGRTFVPLRHPIEALGRYELGWCGETQTVRIGSRPTVGYGLPAPIALDWVHGFYAFGSFAQRALIHDMDSVSFGWGVMEWDAENGARLNTSPAGGNEWHIPEGYQLIANYPRESGARTHLNIFMETSGGLAEMIACENSRRQAVSEIIAELTRVYEGIGRSPFDGITINFEGLRGETARANFTALLTELNAELRPRDLTLYVTVHPATIDGIYFNGYDYRAIGRLADRVILMTHDYHPRSLEGFVGTAWQRHAALTPIAEVEHALQAITHPETGVEDRSKIAIAFSFSNVGWFVDGYNRAAYPRPIIVSNETVLTRMAQPDTFFGWSYEYRNPYIIYTTESGERVFLWYQNSQSIAEKLQLAKQFGITGASVWRLGIIPTATEWDVWDNFTR